MILYDKKCSEFIVVIIREYFIEEFNLFVYKKNFSC